MATLSTFPAVRVESGRTAVGGNHDSIFFTESGTVIKTPPKKKDLESELRWYRGFAENDTSELCSFLPSYSGHAWL